MEMLQLSRGYESDDVLLPFPQTPCVAFLFQVVKV